MDIDSLEEAPIKQKATEEFWKEVDSHPAFVTPETLTDNLSSDTISAIQAIKYESEDPIANATSYKDEGNYFYSKKEFKKAIEAYSGGLKCKSGDNQLDSILATNRGICQFYLKNYGSCIKDCKQALKWNPEYFKPCLIGARAASKLQKSSDILCFCNRGLELSSQNDELKNLQVEALKITMEIEKKANEAAKQTSMEKRQKETVFDTIRAQSIKLDMTTPPFPLPGIANVNFFVDSDGVFHWPVLLVYPEVGETDFLQDVEANSSIYDCLQVFFDPTNPPAPWDPKGNYLIKNDNLQAYIEDESKVKRQINVPLGLKIDDLTKMDRFSVRRNLVITIFIVSKASKNFYKKWLEEIE